MTEEKKSSDGDALAEKLAKALPRLTAEQIAQVSPKFKRMRFAPGEVIIHQDDPPQHFYIVMNGRAVVHHENMSGRRLDIDERTPGSYFGEIGLLKNQPRSATVRAADDEAVDVLVLDREDFLALMTDSRATEAQVSRDMIRHLIHLANFQE